MASDSALLGVLVALAGIGSAAVAGYALRRALRETQHQRVRRWARGVLVGYAVVSVVGFAVGFGRAEGSGGRRLGLGFVGVGIGWLALWFVAVVVLSAGALWAAAHYADRVRPIPPPGDDAAP